MSNDIEPLLPPERSVKGAFGGTLHPTVKGSERARQLARRSVASREAKRAATRADTDAVAAQLRRIIDTYPRDQLGPAAAALALDIIGRVARGEITVRHAQDASELIRTLVDIARLEQGEPTSASVIAHVDASVVAARVAELQRSARAALAAVAVPSDPSPMAPVGGDDQPAT